MKSVFIAIPCYSGLMAPQTEESVARAVEQMKALGWGVQIHRHIGDSVIVRARNVLLAQFLASSCTDMVCLDDDLAWDGDELVRLVSHPEDFVAGGYRAKNDVENYFLGFLETPEIWSNERGLIEVDRVPAGFLKLSRACVERMVTSFAHLAFDDPMAPNGQAWCLFNFELRHNRLWGEDYIFCVRWREIGGKVWIDPELTLSHVGKPDRDGNSKVYTGRIGDWMKRTFSKPEAA